MATCKRLRIRFVLRYQVGKEDITGVKFEPWHYRYVGTALATYMHNNNICLEEAYEDWNDILFKDIIPIV